MFQAGAHLLEALGYRKNHFAHFAQSQDANLYYRHGLRDEDLLALGSSADGVFGDEFYRHPELDEYLECGGDATPPLQGGGVFSEGDKKNRRFLCQLIAAEIPDTRDFAPREMAIIEQWVEAGLLRHDATTRVWVLTNVGSWFISDCVAQLTRYGV